MTVTNILDGLDDHAARQFVQACVEHVMAQYDEHKQHITNPMVVSHGKCIRGGTTKDRYMPANCVALSIGIAQCIPRSFDNDIDRRWSFFRVPFNARTAEEKWQVERRFMHLVEGYPRCS